MLDPPGPPVPSQGDDPTRAATALIDAALARRSPEERAAFWRAVALCYVSLEIPERDSAEAEAALSAQAAAAMV